ncbi:ABC transporter permease [Bacillus subtilis]|uniref:ABC transporter permease n=1 Tax=Bacillus subtilis TaxID=1423 RepID=UPI001D0876B7|nr:ABC transporter permease subunit [Bacillus subtilis]MCB7162030.1 ABC transporter permease [Bacillus subtilis]MCB7460282.1 ABC transporter permease [Bacillus subtilis]
MNIPLGNLKGEIYKEVKDKKNRLNVLLLILFIVFIGVLSGYHKTQSVNWKEKAENTISENKKILQNFKNEDKDYYVGIENEIKLNKYAVRHNIPFVEETTALGFVKKNIWMTFFISIIAIVFASNIITKEYRWGTIKFLLIRPYTRINILLSKFTTILIFLLLLFIILYLSSWLIGIILYGIEINSYTTLVMYGEEVAEQNILINLFTIYFCSFISVLSYCSLTFMISTIFKSNVISIVTSLILALFGGPLSSTLSQQISKYSLFFNADRLMHVNLLKEEITSILIVVSYTILFICISLVFFNKFSFGGSDYD